MGECKFKSSPFSYGEYLDALAKLSPLKQKARFFYVFFSENGFDERIEKEADASALQLFSLDAIVNYK